MNELPEQQKPSMDITYEWGRKSPEELAREASSMDTKIIGIFASSSIIVSLIIVKGSSIKLDLTDLLLGLSLISFLGIFGVSLWGLWGKKFYVTDNPEILRDDWWKLEPQVTKEKYWVHVIESFNTNYAAVLKKSTVISWIVPLLALEVLCLLSWLFLTAFF